MYGDMMSMGETYEDSGSEDVSAFSVSVCVPLCVCVGGGCAHTCYHGA